MTEQTENPQEDRFTVVVVDDYPVLVEAISDTLATKGFDVIATGTDGQEAIEIVEEHDPDVLLIDLEMPRMGGAEAIRAINARTGGDRPRIIVLTSHETDEHVAAALEAGAHGFITKRSTPEQFNDAVRTVAGGGAAFDANVASRLSAAFHEIQHRTTADEDIEQRLTSREIDVLKLIATGLTNKDIAEELGISVTTVKSYTNTIYAKTGAKTRAQAVITAYKAGLVN